MIKGSGFLQITNMKVHVADPCACRRPGPSLATRGLDEAFSIERFCRHLQLPAGRRPAFTRPVGVDFYSEAVRISEIKCLAYQMVGHAGLDADRRKVEEKLAE